jgi:hypothetical protein
MSKLYKLRANRSVKPETLDKCSFNWANDHVRKLVIYNLIDLSVIVTTAISRRVEKIYTPDVFPMQEHKKYGYDTKQYDGLILGIKAQLKGTKTKIVWHPDNATEIEKMK